MSDADNKNAQPDKTDVAAPQHIVRTYARDLAKMQGKEPPPAPPRPPQKKEREQAPSPPPQEHPSLKSPPGEDSETPKERPGIPLDLVVTRRQAQEKKSPWSHLSSLFTPKPASQKEKESRGEEVPVIHKDITITDESATSTGDRAAALAPTPDQKMAMPPGPQTLPSQEPATPVQHPQETPTPPRNLPGTSPSQEKPPTPAPQKPRVPEHAPIPQAPPEQHSLQEGGETREEILKRLREKVARERGAHDRLVEESVLLPKKEAPPVAPTPPKPHFVEPPPDKPSPIHTYKTDFADHFGETHATTASVLAAEQDARPAPTSVKESKSPYNLLFWILGVLFLIAGLGGVGYAFFYHAKVSAPVASAPTIPSLIPASHSQEVSGRGSALMDALVQAIKRASLPEGAAEILYTKIAVKTPQGATTTVPAPGGYLIAALGLPLPSILANNVSVKSMVGIVRAGNQTRPFFVLRVTSYDAAFAGMLQWEPTIATDLAPLYPPYPAVATSTASTTQVSTGAATANSFVDSIVANHDVRILKDASGRSILLYGFRDKKTLIIARNAAAFTNILNRLNNAATP